MSTSGRGSGGMEWDSGRVGGVRSVMWEDEGRGRRLSGAGQATAQGVPCGDAGWRKARGGRGQATQGVCLARAASTADSPGQRPEGASPEAAGAAVCLPVTSSNPHDRLLLFPSGEVAAQLSPWSLQHASLIVTCRFQRVNQSSDCLKRSLPSELEQRGVHSFA